MTEQSSYEIKALDIDSLDQYINVDFKVNSPYQ